MMMCVSEHVCVLVCVLVPCGMRAVLKEEALGLVC